MEHYIVHLQKGLLSNRIENPSQIPGRRMGVAGGRSAPNAYDALLGGINNNPYRILNSIQYLLGTSASQSEVSTARAPDIIRYAEGMPCRRRRTVVPPRMLVSLS